MEIPAGGLVVTDYPGGFTIGTPGGVVIRVLLPGPDLQGQEFEVAQSRLEHLSLVAHRAARVIGAARGES